MTGYTSRSNAAAARNLATLYTDFMGLTYPGGLWAKGFDGEDIVIGVIDTGIWPEHPSFQDDGSYMSLPIQLDDTTGDPCNFGNTIGVIDEMTMTKNQLIDEAKATA